MRLCSRFFICEVRILLIKKKPKEILDYCKAVCPNVFDDSILYRWINEVEGQVQLEIARIAPDSTAFVVHASTDTPAKDLFVGAPHDKLYGEYVCARICEAEGEIARANNYMTRFNDFYTEFAKWFQRNYNPANGGWAR